MNVDTLPPNRTDVMSRVKYCICGGKMTAVNKIGLTLIKFHVSNGTGLVSHFSCLQLSHIQHLLDNAATLIFKKIQYWTTPNPGTASLVQLSAEFILLRSILKAAKQLLVLI